MSTTTESTDILQGATPHPYDEKLSEGTTETFINWTIDQINEQTFVHKEGKHPTDSIIVDLTNRTYCQQGGGFVHPLPADFKLNYRRLLPSDNPHYEPAFFRIDETAEYTGYTLGYYWNGWECPCFEKSEVVKILNDTGMQGDYDPNKDTFTITHPETSNIHAAKGFDIKIADDTKHVYPIGYHSWTWYRSDEESSLD